MFYRIILSLIIMISISGKLMAVKMLEKDVNICGSSAGFGINYMMEDDRQSYSWGLHLFGDKLEARNLAPHIKMIYLQEGGQIPLDSCNICRPFYQYNPTVNLHKYIVEVRKPAGTQSTIALEYGSTDVQDTTIQNQIVKSAYSYFIDLSLPDTIASQYSENETSFNHVFTDANFNYLYEIINNGKVVGIKYYCSNNKQEYIRYFIAKN